jgi:hypothetical protein
MPKASSYKMTYYCQYFEAKLTAILEIFEFKILCLIVFFDYRWSLLPGRIGTYYSLSEIRLILLPGKINLTAQRNKTSPSSKIEPHYVPSEIGPHFLAR